MTLGTPGILVWWEGRDPVIADVAIQERKIGFAFIEVISMEIRRGLWPIGYDPVEVEKQRERARSSKFSWEYLPDQRARRSETDWVPK